MMDTFDLIRRWVAAGLMMVALLLGVASVETYDLWRDLSDGLAMASLLIAALAVREARG